MNRFGKKYSPHVEIKYLRYKSTYNYVFLTPKIGVVLIWLLYFKMNFSQPDVVTVIDYLKPDDTCTDFETSVG